MKKAIIEKIKTCLLEKEEISFAYIHGSFLEREDFRDIDIAIYLEDSRLKSIDSLNYEIDLSLLLEEKIKPGKIYKRFVPFDLKVVNLDCAPVSFRYHASKGKLLFSRDEMAREEFLCRTWQEYFDYKYLADNYLKGVLNA